MAKPATSLLARSSSSKTPPARVTPSHPVAHPGTRSSCPSTKIVLAVTGVQRLFRPVTIVDFCTSAACVNLEPIANAPTPKHPPAALYDTIPPVELVTLQIRIK